MTQISRREFGVILASAAAAGAVADPVASGQNRATGITANDLVERIKKNIGAQWKTETVDTIKAGDPSTVVTGVVTTAMATLSVLQLAMKTGANVVFTCEPTFYGRADARTPAAGRGGGRGTVGAGALAPVPAASPHDPLFTDKNEFIDGHRIVVFRLSDHWRLREPNPFVQGLAAALGWDRGSPVGRPARFDIPEITLATLAGEVKEKLTARGGIRVIGDPNARIRKVALLPGSAPLAASFEAFPGTDAVVAGEVREWESVEYARDAVFSGHSKGLILLGRVVSEDPGMQVCADWLRRVVPEVPVRRIAVRDPYWRPVR